MQETGILNVFLGVIFYNTQNNKMGREFKIFTWKKNPKQHMVNDGHIFCE